MVLALMHEVDLTGLNGRTDLISFTGRIGSYWNGPIGSYWLYSAHAVDLTGLT